MKYWLLILNLLCSSCYAQLNIKEVTTDKFRIEGLSEVEASGDIVFSKTAPTAASPSGKIVIIPEGKTIILSMAYDLATKKFVELKRSETKEGNLIWTWSDPGQIRAKFLIIDLVAGKVTEQEIDLQIKTDVPVPPPTPPPTPTEKLDNLSVLFILETNDLTSYPQPTRQILLDNNLKVWFQQQLPEPGGLSRVRWYDKDDKFTQCTTVFCKWMGTPPPELPWLVVGNEQKIVYSGKLLPIEEIKTLVLKYKK